MVCFTLPLHCTNIGKQWILGHFVVLILVFFAVDGAASCSQSLTKASPKNCKNIFSFEKSLVLFFALYSIKHTFKLYTNPLRTAAKAVTYLAGHPTQPKHTCKCQ